MKKATTALSCLLFALIVLFSKGIWISVCFGYTFKPISSSAFAIIIAVLSVCIVVFHFRTKDAIETKTISVLLAITTLLSLVNTVMYIFEFSIIGTITSIFVFVGCGCFLIATHAKPMALKITVFVLSVLVVWPIGYFGFFAFLFGSLMGHDTVVQTVASPGGKYYAEVIDSDWGALGGDTFVDVYEKSEIDFIIFKMEKKPQRVYSGEWYEFQDMEIHWKDEQCLVINSVEYEIEYRLGEKSF